jgi:MoaA/NifB/PqqE/SkfB family radical SAM enzyme
MIDNDKISWLHVEATSKCNAHCPACPRNNNGYGVNSDLVLQDLSLDKLSNAFKKFPNIKSVQFCGNYGDPIAAKNILEQIEFVIGQNVSKIQIHTNGSLKTVDWWKNLAKILLPVTEAYVEFAIDGIEDVHEIYRQGTSYNKVIENATAFIAAKGVAHWQFIPFKHNQHQIKDCIRLSQQLGFKRFNFVKNARYSEINFHYKTGKPIDIQPWEHDEKFNKLVKQNKNTVLYENCMHLEYPSAYISATGEIFPCCYLADIKDAKYDSCDIEAEILSKSLRKQCLSNCGSCI